MDNTRKKVTLIPADYRDYRWVVTFPKNGKRSRKYFKKKTKAEEFYNEKRAEIQELGTAQAHIGEADRLAITAWHEAKEKDPSLGNVKLLDVVESYLERRAAKNQSVTVTECMDLTLLRLEKTKKSDRHYTSTKNNLKRFVREFEGWMMIDFTADHIDGYLHDTKNLSLTKKKSIAAKWSPITRENHKLSLSLLFNMALSKGYVAANPVSVVEIEDVVLGEPEVYTPEEVAKLLEHCPERSLATMVICLATGMRSSEVGRITWKDVRLKSRQIIVRAGVAKKSRRRVVEIPENFAKWLEPVAQVRGEVRPTEQQYRDDRDKAHKLAEVDKVANGFRHSFSSYHIALHESADKTALILGHADTYVLFKHYEAVVSKEDAQAYFNIMPSKGENITSITT